MKYRYVINYIDKFWSKCQFLSEYHETREEAMLEFCKKTDFCFGISIPKKLVEVNRKI